VITIRTNVIHRLLAIPIALELARKRDPTDRFAPSLSGPFQASAMSAMSSPAHWRRGGSPGRLGTAVMWELAPRRRPESDLSFRL
jgi:hypothetical protein